MPLHLFVYNDLPYKRSALESDPHLVELLVRFEETLRALPNATLIEIDAQIETLARAQVAGSFATTLAIGEAGARVAHALHERTGWFPAIETIPVSRVETAPGQYRIPDIPAVEERLQRLVRLPLAIVDDTLYSGLTLLWVLDRLPAAVARQAEVFCLQAIAQVVPKIRDRCLIHVGLLMQGDVEKDVTIIKASHLFEAGAIRRASGRDLAFFERPAWMRDWFSGDADRITSLCEELASLVDRHTDAAAGA